MNDTYTLNQLAMITSLTTRTLRNHLRQGTLTGEKQDGMWTFTPEDVQRFMANPAVKRSIEANHNALVFDFLSDGFKTANRACVILDYAVDDGEASAISDFFCRAVCESTDLRMCYSRDRGVSRVILSGGEDQVADILSRYYGKR